MMFCMMENQKHNMQVQPDCFWMFLVISENDNLGDKTTSGFRVRLCVIGKKPLP